MFIHFDIMNYIFICTANRDRSKTAEIFFQNKNLIHRFKSAGINKFLSERHGGVHVQRYMLDYADKIICMENCHSDYIVKTFGIKYLDKIEILNLEDVDNFMSKSLIEKLKQKFKIVI